ncbi:hypothetical protein EV715DRAFT_278348 [Schizophyllum commune]
MAYFGAYAALEACVVPDNSTQPQSVLLTAAAEGSVSVYVIFGGQGTSKKTVRWLFYSGLYAQQAFSRSVEGGEGVPSTMLLVTGLLLKDVETHLAKTNKHLPSNSKLHISLYNGPKAFVITGPARALYGLVQNLRKVKAPSGLDQSKVPFSQRKPVFSVRFLVVNAPYHSEYLTGVTVKVAGEDLVGEELWQAADLKVPVYHTENGSDLRESKSSITRELCNQIFTLALLWDRATNFPETATHAVNFGPGGLSGIGPLTARNLDGRGVRVIVTGDKGKGDAELFDPTEIKTEQCWSKKWAPKLVKTSDGTLHLDTPFSRLLGKPPIMVPGMTPSTVQAGFISAVLNAGYHIELAGGGHFAPGMLRAKVAEIQKRVAPGVGVTLNALYINPAQFTFQLPLWQDMRREGLPIEGFCVAAGIPTVEKAAEIISSLQASGIKHVLFKPGSVEGIRQVVAIAAANPDFPVIMQWTGGRAGGHHLYEDFRAPILATYRSIRAHDNLILVGGSGFGSGEDVWPYLTGDWSKEMFGLQPMPFDSFLLGSRVMVAKEAHTSSGVKDLIVAASSVDDKNWEDTYVKPPGGILTVRSELGEPVHKVATRAVKLWKELYDTKDDSAAADLSDMTYEEVVLRMLRLMYVAHQSRWVDISLRNLTGDWIRCVEERFAGVNGTGDKPSLLQSYTRLDDPRPFVEEFFAAYPLAKAKLLPTDDTAYFLVICRRPTEKPVPLISVLDNQFEFWLQKGFLWAAQDVDAVFDQDPQRVCILQCPLADELIKELLGGINSPLITRLLERSYSNDESKVPVVNYLSGTHLTGFSRIRPPWNWTLMFPTAPHTRVTVKGDIVYTEAVREGVRKVEAYVEEMASTAPISGSVNIEKVQEDVAKLWTSMKSQPSITK